MFVAATEQHDDGTPVVRVMGEVDLATVPALEEALLGVERQAHARVIVDLAGCTFLDSSGLRALVGSRERLERSNRRLALALCTPAVLRVLQVTGLDKRFEIYPSLGAASTAMATAMPSGKEPKPTLPQPERTGMRPATSGPKRDRGWRRRVPARATELLNGHWHKLRGGPNPRSCPICAATIPASDDAVHHGGELYHPGCAPEPRPSPDSAAR